MEETKEKTSITALEMQNAVKELLREHIVGLVAETKQGELSFTLPGGQTFSINVQCISSPYQQEISNLSV